MAELPLALFLVTSLIIILTPGQDMMLVMTRSVAMGSTAGFITAAGVSTGLLGHTLLAGLGLGAILQTSELLFTALKIAGAAYLVVLGIRIFLAPPVAPERAEGTAGSLRSVFLQGAVSNLANPKIAIFYFAFLPQFVSVGTVDPTTQLLLLGLTFSLLTLLVKGVVGYLAGGLSAWLRSRPAVQVWLNRASGVVLVGLGVRLAFESRGS